MTCMTCWRTCRRFAESLALVTLLASSPSAQEVPVDALLHPNTDSWPTYHGDYSGQHHSRLTQITPANVKQLTLAWAFQTNHTQPIKATPIVVNGIIYLSAPDNVWAIDARSGRQIWRYTYPAERGVQDRPSRRRGARRSGLPDDARCAPDRARRAHRTRAMERRDRRLAARLLVHQRAADHSQPPALSASRATSTTCPASSSRSIRKPARCSGRSTARHPPARPDSISGGATGGQMWMTGTYDPELNLVYVGTGNPTPVLNGATRPGDNKWTGSIVALNPDTGELEWGFQASPHDTHDWDAAEVPVLVDADFRGAQREAAAAGVAERLLLRARSHHRQEPADRAVCHGELGEGRRRRRTARFPIPTRSRRATAGWSRPTKPAARTTGRRRSIPATGLLIVSAHDAYGIYFFKPEHGTVGWAGADYTVYGRGVLRAIDYQTGTIRWSHDLNGGAGAAGVLTTASGLTFTGDSAHERAGAAQQRRHDAVALRHRARRQLADHLRARRPPVRPVRRRQRPLCVRAAAVIARVHWTARRSH